MKLKDEITEASEKYSENIRVGPLINFNVDKLKDGIKSVIL